MELQTSRFGEISVDLNKEVIFAEGLPGFPEVKRFVLLQRQEDAPFFWLQAVEGPDVAFLLVSPPDFSLDYRPQVPEADLKALDLESFGDGHLFLVAVVPENPLEMTVNMRAPVIINPAKRTGRQLILADDSYPMRYPMFEALKGLVASAGSDQEAQGKHSHR